MRPVYKKSLFIFRRDLRLYDNIALLQALEQSSSVIPCFIFTPEQIRFNPYRSDRSLQFLIESLEDLMEQIKKRGGRLYLFFGSPHKVVARCIRELRIEALFVNRDYTLYSKNRDATISDVCKKNEVAFHFFDDALLHAPEESLKKDGKPYSLFTPFFHRASELKISPPKQNRFQNFYKGSIGFSMQNSFLQKILPKPISSTLHGGREEGLKILKGIEKFSNSSDYVTLPPTTHLSPYLKFNLLSIREVYHTMVQKLGIHHELIRSLYWRDFFTVFAFFFPHVFQGAFHSKYDSLSWRYNRKDFQKWCEGKTGVPIVDAGMRELNQTGFMHNRLRMITASFLVKDLRMNWRLGERYFATKLIDYDPAVNNGNWQWIAGVGGDVQPYFRIFNPWNQQKKYDPKCEYVKKWISEFRDVPPKIIHQWQKEHSDHYFAPMVDHEKATRSFLKMFRSLAELKHRKSLKKSSLLG
jgi:deoxyribodipyrimidine photo-lyase